MHAATEARTPAPRRRPAVAALLGVLLAVSGCTAAGDDGAGADAESDGGRTRGAATASPGPADGAGADARSADRAAADPAAAAAAPTDVTVRSAGLAGVVAPAVVPPVAVTIAALGITVPVDPVGVQADGQMEIPPLAERAGWYRFGPSPADPHGTAVIAAHVDSAASAGLGPFARLPEAAVGDVVDVTLADGAVRQYAVTAVERRAKPEIAWSEVFVRDGGPRLVLVTCGGTFQRDVGRYSDNVIVTAEPVGAPPPVAPAPATGGG